jgi:hypothetical protein
MSDITGKVRVWELFHGQANKPSNGSPLVSITNDVKDGALDPNKNGYLSLLNDSFDAKELIVTLQSGQQEFTLWDGKDLLLAEADPRVAADRLVPSPFGPRLECGISCIRCHGKQQGLQPIHNDVLKMVGGTGRILTDLSKPDKQFDNLRLIQSRYGARQHDVDTAIDNGRESLNRRYDALVDAKDAKAAKVAYAAAAEVYDAYKYTYVTPATACRELGIAPGDDPAATLRSAMPAPNAIGAVAEGSAGTLARLEAGIPITRGDFESVYADLATKALDSLKKKDAKQ